jgi:1-acyl-sn-glycerol-3-phosphate acyltransferase
MYNYYSVGDSLAVSPEGTRSKTGHLRPFKKGGFHLAQQLEWPILPVSIHGAFDLWPPKSGFTRCGCVELRYHEHVTVRQEQVSYFL